MHIIPDKTLISKYNYPVPRYTSYPPANHFHDEINVDTITQLINSSNKEGQTGISLYIHVPFCPHLCHFCACTTCQMPGMQKVSDYFAAVEKELVDLAGKINKGRPVRQIHWGGGTPNGVSIRFLGGVMNTINQHFSVSQDAELAIEAHPGYITANQLDALKSMGFTRISLGVQDIHPNVLDTIHRKKAKMPLDKLFSAIRQRGFHSLNVDLVYGLPGQQGPDFMESLRTISEYAPERLVTFSYAHVPWVKGAQNKLNDIPRLEGDEKLALFIKGSEYLQQRNYKPLGFDHFALPSDPLVKAYEKQQLHRNFMGYAVKDQTGQVYAVGASAISQLHGGYYQNEKDYQKYIQDINKKGAAIVKGYVLTESQQIAREVITQLMCNGQLNWVEMSKRMGISTEEIMSQIKPDDTSLKAYETDGLISYNQQGIALKKQGWFFVRNIASAFDPMYKRNTNHYSKSV